MSMVHSLLTNCVLAVTQVSVRVKQDRREDLCLPVRGHRQKEWYHKPREAAIRNNVSHTPWDTQEQSATCFGVC